MSRVEEGTRLGGGWREGSNEWSGWRVVDAGGTCTTIYRDRTRTHTHTFISR